MSVEQPFSRVPDVPTPGELIDLAFRRASKSAVKLPARKERLLVARLKEIRRIRTVSAILSSRLRAIKRRIPPVDKLHPFYRELFYVMMDVDKFRIALARISRAASMVEGLAKEYVAKLRASSSAREASRVRREYYGRVASIIRELDGDLKVLSEIRRLRRLPSFDFSIPIIIVSGAPNVGKSSFVRCVSTAKPEVAEYPFTTKSVSVGHVVAERGILAQVVDTPGLLDRPLEERNKIELQAIAALKHLEGPVVFLVDPTETCGYPLKYQVDVLRGVKELFKGRPMAVALTKMDIASKGHVERAMELLKGERVYMCSTLNCVGVKEIVEELLKEVKQ
ncbi:MAG: hypothetical protein DRJ68_02150 [Thermoprotei archaeon]|nr:MAG: hypothetical protein DRJ68_02150 [Thermoprotei archaeon]